MARELFIQFDVDKNGIITKEEVFFFINETGGTVTKRDLQEYGNRL